MSLASAADPSIPLIVREGANLGTRVAGDEWLLANRLGGFAMGTVSGVPTRRYHGLLIASMQAPVQRVMALNALDETVVVGVAEPGERLARLTPFEFRGAEGGEPGAAHPNLVRFERGFFGCRWRYEIPFGVEPAPVIVDKTVHLYENRNAVAIRYAVRGPGVPVRIEVRPLVRLADMHHLRRHEGSPHFDVRTLPGGCVLTDRRLGVTMLSAEAAFEHDEQWWHDLTYRWECDRGLDHVEDLASPGVFRWTTVPAAGTGVMTLIASTDGSMPSPIEDDASSRDRRLAEATRRVIVGAGGDGLAQDDQVLLAAMARAADQFVVTRILEQPTPERADPEGAQDASAPEHTCSIIAGYPWFADWGRDAMIALPGLLLDTGRHDEAERVLGLFARHRRGGLIPNRFDEATNRPEYNTVDASLWFVHAAVAHSHAAGTAWDVPGCPRGEVLDACEEILDAYQRGTDFEISMDRHDGLITAGDARTQLTWMDAQRDGITFTPRHGKAVEVNALWVHALRSMALALSDVRPDRAWTLESLADRAATSFIERFWDPETGSLHDRLEPGDGDGQWKPAREVRPNQVIAASLEHSPLSQDQRRSVVRIAREHLLTPMGLRTLSPREPGYRGRFEGPMIERDAAYHNGTVWPWLVGPYVEALLRSEGFSRAACAEARDVLAPLLGFLDGPLIGQLPEVFDGDQSPGHPQRWRGCIAQAWSVAEVLRALALVLRAEGVPVGSASGRS